MGANTTRQLRCTRKCWLCESECWVWNIQTHCRNNLASVLRSMGNYTEAIEMCKQVLAVKERVLGVEHPDTLTTKSNLAAALAKAGNFDDAIKILEGVIPIQEKALGSEHPNTIASRS